MDVRIHLALACPIVCSRLSKVFCLTQTSTGPSDSMPQPHLSMVVILLILAVVSAYFVEGLR